MSTQAPAEVGMPLAGVDTPALIVELDAFERNLRRLPESLVGKPVRLRPHAKTHKSPVIALKQIELGAVGVCCQKVSEAEALVLGGVKDVLIANEVIGLPKLDRLAALAKQAKIAVCVDDPFGIKELSAAAQRFDVRIDVLVEIDVGTHRCGVAPGEPALALAQLVATSRHLRFAGLQAYHGAAQHVQSFAARRAAIESAVALVQKTKSLLEANGLPCERVTGAGTGTYQFEAASGVYNELQAGSYIFMDADYSRIHAEDGTPIRDFEQSLFVWTTVMSRPAADRAVVDAGLKALSVDSGMPLVAGMSGVEYLHASDEHGALKVTNPEAKLNVGDKIKLVPGHCDPTVNLYDWYVGIRHGRVEALWPVAARGAVY
jgi:3-hydroxy-D-aspartate aldolase